MTNARRSSDTSSSSSRRRNGPVRGASAKATNVERTPAEAHRRTRRDHSSETAEDYAEAIADLIASKGHCRVSDLTRRFGVSHVTVTRIVGRLVREGIAVTEPYRPIELTARGRRLAAAAQRRHEIVYRFLRRLGVDRETAAIDAEGIEHHVSPATLRAMARWEGGSPRS